MSSNKGVKGTYAGKEGRELGKHASEKTRGLFSPDDWSCKNCHNINWARRTTCNTCNTPRVNNLGERTGYGGGFMERDEVVEYRHRDQSDSEDEFDEFGRKKKRFRKSAQPPTRASEPPRSRSPNRTDTKIPNNKAPPPVTATGDDDRASNNDDDDEGEEAEESGDDADLSKYDIWSGDEGDGSGVTPKAGAEAKRTDEASDSATSDSDTRSSSSSSSSGSSRGQKRGSSHSSSGSSSSEEPELNGRPRRRSRDTGRDRSRSPLA